jgi:hypothetical protein
MSKEMITTNEYRALPSVVPGQMWEPLAYVDATPNDGFVLRILRAHLKNCDGRWHGSDSELLKQMNEWQEKRAKLLSEAIAILGHPKKENP